MKLFTGHEIRLLFDTGFTLETLVKTFSADGVPEPVTKGMGMLLMDYRRILIFANDEEIESLLQWANLLKTVVDGDISVQGHEAPDLANVLVSYSRLSMEIKRRWKRDAK